MKKILKQFILSLCLVIVFIPVIARALDSSDFLMSLGMSPELANQITTTLIGVNSSGNVVVPVASGKKLSITVAGTEKASVTSGGVLTGAVGITATTGDITATAGEFISSTSGKTLALQEATAAAACMGTLTCNGASDVVTSTTCATTGSRIFLTRTSLDADTTGDFYVKSISNGVSFTVACETSDTGTLNWIIFHEAA